MGSLGKNSNIVFSILMKGAYCLIVFIYEG